MAIQASGAIAFTDLQTEYGGVTPISMSEYYKGGAYVLDSVNSFTAEGPVYSSGTPSYTWNTTGGANSDNFNVLQWNWDGTNGVRYVPGSTVTASSITYGEFTYFRSTYQSSGGGYRVPTIYYHSIRREGLTVVSRNLNVPNAGAISLNNFYGQAN